MDDLGGAIIGFIIFITSLVYFVTWFSENKNTDRALKKIEKFFLSLKIPNWIVAIIMYFFVIVPYCMAIYIIVLFVDYLGFG